MSKQTTQSPPYVAYTTFKTALKNLEHVPSTIDKSCFPKMSGTGISQLFGALRCLKLIDDKGVPSNDMKTLGDKGCDESEWKKTMRGLVEQYYADQLDALANGTSNALKKAFGESVGASVVTPACRFLIQAAQDAGVTVSPTIANAKMKSPTKRRPPPVRAKLSKPTHFEQEPPTDGNQFEEDMIDFPIHIPGKPTGKITVPKKLTKADLVMIKAMMTVVEAYAESSGK